MRLLIPGFSFDTQCDLSADLARYYGLPLVTLNASLTDAIRAQTYLGRHAQACLESGRLIPDGLIIQLLEERLTESDMRGGWVLSGFPRTVSQAVTLRSMLSDIAQLYDAVLYVRSSSADPVMQTSLVRFFYGLSPLLPIDSGLPLSVVDRRLKRSLVELADA